VRPIATDPAISLAFRHTLTLQQAPAHERAQTKADRIENPMIARHFFEIDKGMERVFAHSPHMPASAIPKITQTLPRSSRRPPIPRALPNPTRKVAKEIGRASCRERV